MERYFIHTHGTVNLNLPVGPHERTEAMKWWNELPFEKKKFYSGSRHPSHLTGREIHIIYKNRIQ